MILNFNYLMTYALPLEKETLVCVQGTPQEMRYSVEESKYSAPLTFVHKDPTVSKHNRNTHAIRTPAS